VSNSISGPNQRLVHKPRSEPSIGLPIEHYGIAAESIKLLVDYPIVERHVEHGGLMPLVRSLPARPDVPFKIRACWVTQHNAKKESSNMDNATIE
jgi:hypothetical protein